MTNTSMIKFLACVSTTLLGFASLSHGATSLYYQFGNTGNNSVTDSSGNGLTGTMAGVAGGSAPAYSSETPGLYIFDGLGGTIINSSNISSMKFDNSGVPSTHTSQAGGQVYVGVTPTNQAKLQPTNFTIEGFVRAESNISYAGLFGMTNATGVSWALDNNPSINNGTEPTSTFLRARFDHASPTSEGAGNNDSKNSSGDFGVLTGGLKTWHHVAMTYNEATNAIQIFLDYQSVLTATLSTSGSQDLVYLANGLFSIGGFANGSIRAFDGWIDEVRFSDTILGSNAFLRASNVPEPSRAFLFTFAGAALLFRRKKTTV